MVTMAPKSRINIGNIWLAYEDTILINHIKTSYFNDTYGSFTLTVGETKTRTSDYTIRLNSVTELGRVVDITVTELNPTCTPWTCDPSNPGYEVDRCGNRRPNPLCGSATHKECVNNTCQVVAGAGTDNCSACQSNPTPALYVDGKQGSVSVALNAPVVLKMQGIGAGKSVRIDNISAIPDEIIAQGTTDSNGVFQTTVNFSEYVSAA